MRVITGIKASAGVAFGPVVRIDRGATGLHRIVSDPYRERALYEAAIVLAKDELNRLQQHAQGTDADILLFQNALLEDESFTNEIGDYIAAGAGSATAVERAEQIFTARLKDVPDAYIQERAVDVRDACRRVIDILDGRPRRHMHLTEPSILAAEVFFPSDLFSLDRKLVLGLLSDKDSTTSHAAILARSFGIPAIVRLGEGTAMLAEGQRAVLDAEHATLILDPEKEQVTRAKELKKQLALRAAEKDPLWEKPCCTRDGKPFTLVASANVSSPDTISDALAAGAAAIGLVRTESLALGECSEAEQRMAFINCLAAAEGAPVIFRIANDSVLEEMHQLTMTDKRQALGEARRNQLRALLRAALVGPLSVVFPGVTDPVQWQQTMESVRRCGEALQQMGVPCVDKVSCGCVIDSPAAAIMAGEIIAGGADFLLIDGNSLARHTGGIAQDSPLDAPAVLRLADMAIRAADEHHTPVYFGSFGEETAALPAFLRLGARIFCTEASLIRDAKAVLIESSTD